MNHPTTPAPAPARVVVLNGTSSSGKSSIAKELSGLLPEPHAYLKVDDFYRMMNWPDGDDDDIVEEALPRIQAGFHRAVAAMARCGTPVLVDLVLSRAWRLPDLLGALDGLDTVLVGVHCDPAELARRERERGDRAVGQAARQLPVVHAHARYDVEVDTTTATPRACAETIAAHLAARTSS